MKRLAKILMIILSYSPIATVAIAAQAKANEIEGEIQTYNPNPKIGLRHLLYRFC